MLAVFLLLRRSGVISALRFCSILLSHLWVHFWFCAEIASERNSNQSETMKINGSAECLNANASSYTWGSKKRTTRRFAHITQ